MLNSFLVPAEVTALLCFLVPLMCRAMWYHHKRSTADLSELLARLEPLSKVGIEEIAFDVLQPSPDKIDLRSATRMEPADIWTIVGGIEGVKIMERNAQVLIDLAFYVQRWSPEASFVAEQMRLDAREITRHLHMLRRSFRNGPTDQRTAACIQRATAFYYLMTRRILSLYEVQDATLLPQVRAAL